MYIFLVTHESTRSSYIPTEKKRLNHTILFVLHNSLHKESSLQWWAFVMVKGNSKNVEMYNTSVKVSRYNVTITDSASLFLSSILSIEHNWEVRYDQMTFISIQQTNYHGFLHRPKDLNGIIISFPECGCYQICETICVHGESLQSTQICWSNR